MAVRDQVRDAQRTLARLDAAHMRARAKLAQALARRSEVVADQDRLVAAVEAEVNASVAAMATAVGPDLAADLLGIDPATVRRVTKARDGAGGGRR